MKNPFVYSKNPIYQILFDRIKKEENPEFVLNKVNTFISKQTQIINSLYEIEDVIARCHIINILTKNVVYQISEKIWHEDVKQRVKSILLGKLKQCLNITNRKISEYKKNQIKRCNKIIDDEQFEKNKFYIKNRHRVIIL